MKRVLVTGATGFLGSNTVRELTSRGFEVVATGRDLSKAPQRSPLVNFVAADLSNRDDVQRLAARAGRLDAIIHAAALSSPWGPKASFKAANVTATEHILRLAEASGARRFVYVSTPSVYFRFADQFGIRETAPLPPPINHYAHTKRLAERLVLGQRDWDGFILRPRGLYGAGDQALLPRLIRTAEKRALPLLRDGQAVTDLTHVDDATGAILAALAAPADAAGIYNISGGEPLRLTEIVERACARSGVSARWRPISVQAAIAAARAMEWACACLRGKPEPPVTAYGIGVLAFSQTLDIDAAERALGWSPRVCFAEGLDRTFGSETFGS